MGRDAEICASLAKMTSTENAGMQGYSSLDGKGLSLLGALRRRWPIIVITMVIAGGAAAAFAFATNKDYESTATLVFRQTIAPQLNSIGLIPNTVAADNLAEDNRERVASKAVAVDASEALAGPRREMSPADVQDDVKVVGRQDQRRGEGHRLRGRTPSVPLSLANVYAASAQPPCRRTRTRSWRRMALASLRRQFDALPANVQNHVSGPGAQLRNNMQKMQVIADVGNGSPQIVQPGYVPSDKSGSPVTTICWACCSAPCSAAASPSCAIRAIAASTARRRPPSPSTRRSSRRSRAIAR